MRRRWLLDLTEATLHLEPSRTALTVASQSRNRDWPGGGDERYPRFVQNLAPSDKITVTKRRSKVPVAPSARRHDGYPDQFGNSEEET